MGLFRRFFLKFVLLLHGFAALILLTFSHSNAMPFVVIGDLTLEPKGYIKNTISASETASGENFLVNLTRARADLNLKWKETLSFRAVYDHEWYLGDYLRTEEFHELSSARDRDLLQLEGNIVNRSDLLWRHRLYRAYGQYRGEKATLTLGRQRIAWGTGKFWNPTDLFNPFNPIQLEREERKGVDALNAELFLDTLSSLNLVYAPQKSSDETRTGVRFRTSHDGSDFSIIAGRFQKDKVIGGDFATTLGDGGFRGEMTYTNAADRSNFFRILVGYDYTWANSLYFLIEYFYNGGPQPEFNYVTFLQNEIATLRKNFLGLNLGYDISPLLRAENYIIYDLDGESIFLWPRIVFSVTQNLDISGGVQIFSGKPGSEFNVFNNLYYGQIEYHY